MKSKSELVCVCVCVCEKALHIIHKCSNIYSTLSKHLVLELEYLIVVSDHLLLTHAHARLHIRYVFWDFVIFGHKIKGILFSFFLGFYK